MLATHCMEICAVVPAAGLGHRMQTELPKQYIQISEKTILEHSVDKLLDNPKVNRVVIVIRSDDKRFALSPLAKHPKVTVVYGGGDERVGSVLAGLQCVGRAQWVLVHDAVRPCLHQDDLTRLLEISERNSIGAILATPVRDTMKVVGFGGKFINHTVERSNLWHALTPQFYPRKILYDCLTRALNEGAIITDEASALEYCNLHPEIVEGRSDNIKVTCPVDLALTKCYLKELKKLN